MGKNVNCFSIEKNKKVLVTICFWNRPFEPRSIGDRIATGSRFAAGNHAPFSEFLFDPAFNLFMWERQPYLYSLGVASMNGYIMNHIPAYTDGTQRSAAILRCQGPKPPISFKTRPNWLLESDSEDIFFEKMDGFWEFLRYFFFVFGVSSQLLGCSSNKHSKKSRRIL